MAIATGVGSWPGTSFTRALDEVASVLGAVPFLPELPHRGVDAGMIGRTLGAMRGGPAGELLAEDLALWAPVAGHDTVTVSLAGPWTLAQCTGEDPVELGPELAEAAHRLVRAAEAATGAAVTLQLDEPMLPGAATADFTGRYGSLLSRIDHHDVVVHSCALPAPVGMLREVGVRGSVDSAGLASLPAGWRAGIVPTTGPIDVDALAAHLRQLVPPGDRDGLVVAPTCGLGLSDDAVQRLGATARVAWLLSEG